MRQSKAEVEEYEKEIRRYLNGNIELKRELDEIKKQIPDTHIDFKNQDAIESVKPPLELLKVFGSKL